MRDKDGEEQIQAIAAYLWQDSFDIKAARTATRQRRTRQRTLRNVAAVSPVTRSAKATTRSAATLPRTCRRVGEKANFDYIVRWIHNPRERVAPYCPKEKRDLTAEDYAKKNLPFVFDTELHSRCPNDGAELQVQNMTVMPNFRLSETDARDIATYLFSLSSPPSYAARVFHGRREPERERARC